MTHSSPSSSSFRLACSQNLFRSLIALLTVLASVLPATVIAQDDRWRLCGPAFRIPERGSAADLDPTTVDVSADDADLSEQGVSSLRGNVRVRRGSERLDADAVDYDRSSDLVSAQGNVRYWNEDLFVSGERGRIDLRRREARIENAEFMLEGEHARGEADEIRLSGSDLARIQNGRYTTCDPGSETWWLEASKIKLLKSTDTGIAHHARVRFKGVPIFYTPFLTFPLSDRRKTGFLVPRYGNSKITGVEATLPFYWNIAPNQDATFRVRAMSRRGAMLGSEYRYLTRQWRGTLAGEYIRDGDRDNDDRGAFTLQKKGTFGTRWSSAVDIQYVSDDDYLQDFGTGLDVTSTQFLNRSGDLFYSGNFWTAQGKLQGFQTVDPTIAGDEKPYARLPQLLLATALPARSKKLLPGLRAEFVNFDRDAGVTGQRLDLQPSLSFPLRAVAGFFTPRASLRHTQYDLSNSTLGGSTPSRTLPAVSLDSGLFFERPFNFSRESYLQSIEPRLFYLYVPFRDQTDLPVFDTAENTFDFQQLFRENRFSGTDRVADANQLSLAVTSRMLSQRNGEELLRASVGQIRYFRDQRVTLPDTDPNTDRSSDIIADIAARVAKHWRTTAFLQYDTSAERTQKNSFSLRYQPDSRHIANLSYRFVRGAVEQVDTSFFWSVARNWGLVGRWAYSLDRTRTLGVFGGFEYNTCCWAVRAVARRFLNDFDGNYNNTVFLQLELKGLAGVGGETGEFLRRNIPGYENEF